MLLSCQHAVADSCLCGKHVAEIMLQQRVLCIPIENKIKACPTIEVKLLTSAKINVFWVVLTSLLAEKKNILGLSPESVNTFLSAAVSSVFSHTCSFLLIIFPLTAISRRLCCKAGPFWELSKLHTFKNWVQKGLCLYALCFFRMWKHFCKYYVNTIKPQSQFCFKLFYFEKCNVQCDVN